MAGQWNATLLACSETHCIDAKFAKFSALFICQPNRCQYVGDAVKSSCSIIHPSSLPLRPTNSTMFVIVLTLALINIAMESRLLVSRASRQFFPRSNLYSPSLLPLHTTSLVQCSQCNALATPRHQQSMSCRQLHVNFKPSISPHCTQLQHLNKSSTQAFKLHDSLNNQSTRANHLRCCLVVSRI